RADPAGRAPSRGGADEGPDRRLAEVRSPGRVVRLTARTAARSRAHGAESAFALLNRDLLLHYRNLRGTPPGRGPARGSPAGSARRPCQRPRTGAGRADPSVLLDESML